MRQFRIIFFIIIKEIDPLVAVEVAEKHAKNFHSTFNGLSPYSNPALGGTHPSLIFVFEVNDETNKNANGLFDVLSKELNIRKKVDWQVAIQPAAEGTDKPAPDTNPLSH